jgi:uncharacterized membrane protein YgcG
MAELGGLSPWRHGVVAASVLGCAVLAGVGVIGADRREERFESKQVVIEPAGGDALRITETVDIDFGSEERRGYQRIIPNDFGAATDVEASSPDAPDDVDVSDQLQQTRIRIGDPDTTITGQHRYVLSYTLPAALVSSGQLALDVIDVGEELETERFEVVVDGLQLEDPLCNVGSRGAVGGCELVPMADGTYRAVIEPLEAGDGITIGGQIVGVREPIDVAEPPLPPRITEDSRLPLAISMIPLGLASGGAVYLWSRRRGRNEVFAGGAADAAYGPTTIQLAPGTPLPPPSSAAAGTTGATATAVAPADDRAVRLVADEKLAELATIEFAPPTGLQPWQGAVLVTERIDDGVVGAWFSGLAARDVLAIERNGDDDVVLRRGDRFDAAAPDERELLTPVFQHQDALTLSGYDQDFAEAWRDVRTMQGRAIASSGWWKHDPPQPGAAGGHTIVTFVVILFAALIFSGSIVGAALGLLSSPLAAIAFGIVVPAVVALLVYRPLRPARSATGSALALRTESFRRFLEASEGRHVEWAWSKGLLREYSAWAVALGAAAAWKRALAASSVPPVEYVNGPLLVYTMSPAFSSAHTAPSTSSGGGGGGFSGGSVGGGGGGGSSGSW